MRKSHIISKFAFSASALVFAVACGQAKWHETEKKAGVATFTGDPVAERQTTPTNAGDLRAGQTVTVNPNRLCGRRIPNGKPCDDKDLPLEKGDKVVVDDPTPHEGHVKVHVVDTNRKDVPDSPVYVPPQYLNPTDGPTVDSLGADKYFVIENVATEKLRLYKKVSACENQLILETDMTVGLDAPGKRTKVGSFTLAHWDKFQEDGESAAWYSPEYPRIPSVGSDLMSWSSKSILPHGKKHLVRGAYGWYTASLEPNGQDQALEGTIGWGSDSGKFIDDMRRSPLDRNPRLNSRGATRIENPAIAMIREVLVEGSRVVRIYAKESSHTQERRQLSQWPYILTTENGESAPRSGRRSVLQRSVSRDLYLEHGNYEFKSSATAIPLSDSDNRHRNGNSYHVPKQELVGTFFVDEGRLTDDYHAPRSLETGGHADGYLPSVIFTSRRCETPAPAPQPIPAPVVQPMPEPTAVPELPPIIPEQPAPRRAHIEN